MIIVMQNKHGVVVGIKPDGLLYLKDRSRTEERDLESFGFTLIYTRRCISGEIVTRYERNDGTILRHFAAKGSEWWDTGEFLCKPADIDVARKVREQEQE